MSKSGHTLAMASDRKPTKKETPPERVRLLAQDAHKIFERFSKIDGVNPKIKDGNVYLYYGNSVASTTSSLTKTFPKNFSSSGNTTLSGTQNYDSFQLNAGHTITVGQGQVLTITARRVVINGVIDGNGRGYSGGGSGSKGQGTGGGGGASGCGGGRAATTAATARARQASSTAPSR